MVPTTNCYSTDLKYRVIDMAITQKLSVVQIAKIMNISKSSIYNWLKQYKQNNNLTKKQEYIKPTSIVRNKQVNDFIGQHIDNNQNFDYRNLINEINTQLKISIKKSTLYNMINNLDYTQKVVSFKKIHGSSEKNIEKLNTLKENFKNVDINNVISIDEVSFDTNLINNKAWSKKGVKIIKKINSTWKRLTNVCAISNKKIVSNVTIDNSCDSTIFLDFIKQLPLTEQSILFFDNASIHHSKILVNYLTENNIKHIYNVPYSPEYNPIEYIFSKVKKNIKNMSNSKVTDLRNNIQLSYSTINQSDLTNTFNHSFNLLK